MRGRGKASRSALLPCFAFVLPLPALVCRPTATKPFQAEGPRVANKQAAWALVRFPNPLTLGSGFLLSSQLGNLATWAPSNSTEYKSWTALLRKSHHSSLAADKIQMKCQTLKACCRHTAQRILGIVQTLCSNVSNVIGVWTRV